MDKTVGNLNREDQALRTKIISARQELEIQEQALQILEGDCEHVFVHGHQGDDTVVYCLICNKNADQIWPDMASQHINNLV